MSKNKKASVGLNCKIDKSVFELLEQYANHSNMSKTSIVEEALKKYIAEKKNDEELLKQYHLGNIDFVNRR